MRYLGVDYGRKRVGLAVSDPAGTMAFPFKCLIVSGLKDCARKICVQAVESEVSCIVVGLPVHMGGAEGELAREVRRLCGRLGRLSGLPVRTFDERLTSRAAEAALAEAGLDARRMRGKVDAVAATLMLQAFLDRLNAE